MYENYFGLTERPFSIAPDPQYLYMSKRHKEAMAHLSYGLTQGGCFIVLTGEVGTGKTTLCRNLLAELPNNVDIALILNANINEFELLQSICDELKIEYGAGASQKQLLDSINQHLLSTFADNRHTVLIIDEAQILSRNVLEQIRLLTNLETTKAKLLQIILIGQPELNDLLLRNDLRQLTQRVTARYHLGALPRAEIEDYINFRLGVAGCKRPIFTRQALNKLHSCTEGIPRKINVIADRALLAAYAKSARVVDAKTVKTAADDVFIERGPLQESMVWFGSAPKIWLLAAVLMLVLNIGLWKLFVGSSSLSNSTAENESQLLPVDDAARPVSTKPVSTETVSTETVSTETTGPASIDSEAALSPPQPAAGRVVVASQPLDDEPTLPTNLAAEFRSLKTPVSDAEQSSLSASAIKQPTARRESDTAFGQLLETSADRTSHIAALRGLASIWGSVLPDQLLGPACEEVLKLGLRCMNFEDWPQWIRYNRPAVLVVTHKQQLHQLVVTSVGDKNATIVIGGQSTQVPIDELRQRWVNQGVLLWRPRTGGEPFLRLGDSGKKVLAAREQLNLALLAANLPLINQAEGSEFNLDMAQKLFALQTRFKIKNDGIMGMETWLLIDELTAVGSQPILRDRG